LEQTRIRVYLLTGDIRLANRMGLQITVALPDVTRSAVVSTPASVFPAGGWPSSPIRRTAYPASQRPSSR
jgi:hypothetical protein